MDAKVVVIGLLAFLSNTVWASGGLSLDNVEQHMNAKCWIATESVQQKIVSQGPIDRYEVKLPNRTNDLVNTNQFKQSYDGRS